MKGRRHRVGIHDRRVADFTEAASRRRRHASNAHAWRAICSSSCDASTSMSTP
jgi:hypothetical protein